MFPSSFYSTFQSTPPSSPMETMQEESSSSPKLKTFMEMTDSEFSSVRDKINQIAIGSIPREDHINLTQKAYKDAIKAASMDVGFSAYDEEVKKKICNQLLEDFKNWKFSEKTKLKEMKDQEKLKQKELKERERLEKQRMKEKEKLEKQTKAPIVQRTVSTFNIEKPASSPQSRPISTNYPQSTLMSSLRSQAKKPREESKVKVSRKKIEELPNIINTSGLVTPEALDLVSIVCKLASMQLKNQ